MTQQNSMSSWLRLSVVVTLFVAILPGLLASSLEAVNLRERDLLAAGAIKDPLCNNQLTSCDSCNKIRNCVKIRNTYYNTGIPTECGLSTPWCAEENGAASCVAELPRDVTCNKPKSADFVCTQAGYFPDVSSCTKYYVCVEDPTTNELAAYSYDCSAFPNTRYDAATARCKVGRCLTLTCPHRLGATFELWGQAPWIYASCLDSNPRNALVGACPKGQAWNGVDCVQSCLEEGRFAALTDTTGTKFVECVALDSTGTLSLPVPGVCPVGSRFSSAESLCVEVPPTTPVPTTTAAPATTAPATSAAATTTGPSKGSEATTVDSNTTPRGFTLP